MIRILKYIFYGLIGLVILLLLLLMFTQTRPFRELVRSRAENMANEQLNGYVEIGALEGSFFSDLALRDVKVEVARHDTLMSFDRLALQYDLWPLLRGTIQIHSIVFERLHVNLAQRADSSWNFEELFPSSAPDTTDTLSSKPFGFAVELGALQLREANVHLNMLDSVVPSYVSNIHLDVGGKYNSDEWEVDLRDFGFVTPPAMPDVKQLRGSLINRDGVLGLKDFALVTPRNRLDAKGEYTGMEQLSGGINTSPFHLDEFTWILPDIQLGVAPEIDVDAGVEDRDLTIDLSLADGNEQFALKGRVLKFPALLSDSTRHQGELDLSASFRKLDPQKWFLLTDVPLILNGHISMKGNGLSGSQLPLKVNGDFSGSRWQGHLFRKLGFEGTYLDGETHLTFQTATEPGRIDVTGQGHINQPDSPFQLEVKADEFPAHRFLPEWGDSTILNMELTVDGTGNHQENLKAGFSLDIFNSLVARVSVDTLTLAGQYNKGDVALDTLSFLNKSLNLKGEGSYARNGDVTGFMIAGLTGLDAFSAYVEVPATWKDLSFKGGASGHLDSLMVDLLMDADSLAYDTIARVGDLHFQGNALLKTEGLTGSGNLMMNRIEAAGQNLDSLHFSAGVTPDEWDAGLSAWMPDSVSLTTQMNGNWDAPYKISIPVLEIHTPYESFSVEGTGPRIYADTSRMELADFHLGARRNGRFDIRGRGIYVPDDSIYLDFNIEHFDLSLPEKLSLISEPAGGVASVGLHAKGPLNDPDIKLNARVDSLKFSQFLASRLDVDLAYLADTLHSSLAVQNVHGDSITANMMAPVEINLTDSQMVSSFDAIDGRLRAKDVRPSAFYEFDDSGNRLLKVLMNADVAVTGSIAEPVMKGSFRLSNGELSLPAYGIRYRDLTLSTRLDSNRVMVDSLFTRRDKGTFLVSGHVGFDSTLVSGQLSEIDMTLKADEFFLSKHANHEIQIDADTWLETRQEGPVFGGELVVLRSGFYLPALLDMGGTSEENKPLLVQALDEKSVSDTLVLQKDSLFTEEIIKVDTSETAFMMEELTGKINVQIPRNTWVRSEDMTMELYGDLDILKNQAYFEIFGNVGISRGYYTLYGRKLTIREGELTFQGGEEPNPRVNLEAIYQFRDQNKQKNELIMRADGTAFEPNLSFTLNGTPITERDAMAYLIFNQPFDQLSFGNQEGVSGNLPSAMLSGLVSSQLTKTVGNTFDLDMVEIKAGDDWESATIMVGKYLTNNLFVTYQRGFGERQEESLTPQVITLEYEVTRNVSLRLIQGDAKDSGVDVILKFEK